MLLVFSLMLIFCSDAVILDNAFSLYHHGFTFIRIVFLLLFVVMLILQSYIILDFIKGLFKPNNIVELKFILRDKSEYDVRLLSITKHEDFVVEILNNDAYVSCEVLFNKVEIQKIVFYKTMI
ncbi:hypothetical protein A3849_26695 [Paenibacillus sp. P46E]|nr:hypothetical protein A3849_26695 [Paenibacillus sp. P46E]